MYGWRAKIGHVAPSRGDTLVYEFYKMLPEGFMLLNSTGTIRQLVDADFERQLQRIEEAAADLVDNKCDAIIVGGSPLFTKLGYGSDVDMGRKLTAKYGVPISPGNHGRDRGAEITEYQEARRGHAARRVTQSENESFS